VKGEYENGVVRLIEKVPAVSGKKMLITFFEEDDNEEQVLRQATLQQPQEFLKSCLSDEREDLYQKVLNKNSDDRNRLSKQLKKESKLGRNESMRVLKEFERLNNQD